MDTLINPLGISNILSILRLEKDGYRIAYDTKEDCLVKTP